MSSEDGFVTTVAASLSRALTPFVDAAASSDALAALLARLGWSTSPTADIVDELADAAAAISRLVAHVDEDASAATLVADVIAAIAALAALRGTALSPGAGAPFDDAAFWQTLPAELLALLIDDGLAAEAPALHGTLRFLGIIRIEPRAADAARGRLAYDARVLDWSVIGRAVAAPQDWFADTYGWGGTFDHARFVAAVEALVGGLGGVVARLPPPGALLDRYMSADNAERGRVRLLATSPLVFEPPVLTSVIKPTLFLMPLPPAGAHSRAPDGLLLWPAVSGAPSVTPDLGPGAALAIAGEFQAVPIRVQVRPSGTTIEDAARIGPVSARLEMTPVPPMVLAGVDDGTRLVVARAHFGLAVDRDGIVLDAAFDEASAIFAFGGADSFLRGVLAVAQATVPLSAAISWSSDDGLRFSGSALPSLTIVTDLELAGVLRLSEIRAEIQPGDGDAAVLCITVVGGIVIGPMDVIVEHMGLALSATPATLDAPGNFGLVDLALGFKPPTGLGIGVDLEGVVTGGGYLSIDGGRYAGVGALKFLGVGLTVVGIVETELPEDPDGWSMFLSVIADFTPVPLGFGFFLSGVGGFMGLHRTLDEIALAEGAREGRLDSLLFPEDPLADAIRIITDIEAYFPTLQDTHAFGAMARIDWGVPALISGELGVVVVVPEFRIAVVGEIESILPTPQAPLIELHMSVVGYIDPAELTFWVTASIYDSRLVWYALSGDMAMYVSLGDDPYFLLSVGGFHPDWSPPKSVPASMRSLRRMSAAIDLGEDLQVGLDAYFAITSNSLQFGAEVFAIARMRELGVDFSAEGSFGFDVLVIFTPFSIVAEMSAEIAIKAEGETLLATKVVLHLEGPEPWYGRATATFNFLGQPIAFNVTVGGQVAPDVPDTIDVWTELEPALRDPASWAVPVFDAGTMPEVTLRPLDAAIEAGLWLAPDGAIELRQRVVPLNRTIERFGAFVPVGETRFTVDAAGLASGVETERHAIEDWFAPAQFVVMRAEERLSAPSFEEMDAGVSFGASGAVAPDARDDVAAVDLAYEELVLEDETRGIGVTPFDSGLSAIEMWPVQTGTVSMTSDRAVSGITQFGIEPARYDVADPLDATRVVAGGSYADAVVARRASVAATRTRIVASQEIAA